MQTTANNPALLNITSVPAETIAADQLQIRAGWKTTEKRIIPAANKVRAVILPANIWTNELQTAADNKPLALFMHDAIAELAKDYLSSIVEASNWTRVQVPLSDFHLSSLLAWNAEQAAISGRLNGDEIKSWISQSATVTAISTTHGATVAAAVGEQLIKLASPNHGWKRDKAEKFLSSLWVASDADSTTGLRVMLRLTAISTKQETDSANVLDSIM